MTVSERFSVCFHLHPSLTLTSVTISGLSHVICQNQWITDDWLDFTHEIWTLGGRSGNFFCSWGKKSHGTKLFHLTTELSGSVKTKWQQMLKISQSRFRDISITTKRYGAVSFHSADSGFITEDHLIQFDPVLMVYRLLPPVLVHFFLILFVVHLLFSYCFEFSVQELWCVSWSAGMFLFYNRPILFVLTDSNFQSQLTGNSQNLVAHVMCLKYLPEGVS